jgi:hypothetical protein
LKDQSSNFAYGATQATILALEAFVKKAESEPKKKEETKTTAAEKDGEIAFYINE